jgi:hypothetical protein
MDTLFVNMSYQVEPGSAKEVFQTTYKLGKDSMLFYLSHVPTGVKIDVRVGGPQIVARSSALEKIGGIPHLPRGEDTAVSKALATAGNYQHAPDIVVVTADRARTDGTHADTAEATVVHGGPPDEHPLLRARLRRHGQRARQQGADALRLGPGCRIEEVDGRGLRVVVAADELGLRRIIVLGGGASPLPVAGGAPLARRPRLPVLSSGDPLAAAPPPLLWWRRRPL